MTTPPTYIDAPLVKGHSLACTISQRPLYGAVIVVISPLLKAGELLTLIDTPPLSIIIITDYNI